MWTEGQRDLGWGYGAGIWAGCGCGSQGVVGGAGARAGVMWLSLGGDRVTHCPPSASAWRASPASCTPACARLLVLPPTRSRCPFLLQKLPKSVCFHSSSLHSPFPCIPQPPLKMFFSFTTLLYLLHPANPSWENFLFSPQKVLPEEG